MVNHPVSNMLKFTGFLPPRADNAHTGHNGRKHYTMRPAFLATISQEQVDAKKLHIKTWGCQMNEYDSSKWPICWMPPTAIN